MKRLMSEGVITKKEEDQIEEYEKYEKEKAHKIFREHTPGVDEEESKSYIELW